MTELADDRRAEVATGIRTEVTSTSVPSKAATHVEFGRFRRVRQPCRARLAKDDTNGYTQSRILDLNDCWRNATRSVGTECVLCLWNTSFPLGQILPEQPVPNVSGFVGTVGCVLCDVALCGVVALVLECDGIRTVTDAAKFGVLHVAA